MTYHKQLTISGGLWMNNISNAQFNRGQKAKTYKQMLEF